MDKGKATDRFLKRVDRFSQMPLITGEEVASLFGEEVTQALAQLEHFTAENRICAECGGVCCRDIGCELYASQFGQCPIHEFRPIVCRFHFCQRFDGAGKSLIVELRDIFLGCLTAVDFRDSASLRSLDIPPLAEFCPELIAAVCPWVQAVRDGRLDPRQGANLVLQEAAEYHNVYSTGARGTDDHVYGAISVGQRRIEIDIAQDGFGTEC